MNNNTKGSVIYPTFTQYRQGYHHRWEVEHHWWKEEVKLSTGDYPSKINSDSWLNTYLSTTPLHVQTEIVRCKVCVEKIQKDISDGRTPWEIPQEYYALAEQMGIRRPGSSRGNRLKQSFA